MHQRFHSYKQATLAYLREHEGCSPSLAFVLVLGKYEPSLVGKVADEPRFLTSGRIDYREHSPFMRFVEENMAEYSSCCRHNATQKYKCRICLSKLLTIKE